MATAVPSQLLCSVLLWIYKGKEALKIYGSVLFNGNAQDTGPEHSKEMRILRLQ